MKKICFRCGETKSLSEFYKHPQMSDGYLNKCKACTKSDVRANRVNNREYYRQYEKTRSKTTHRKQVIVSTQRRQRAANRQKGIAWSRVGHAMRRGSIAPKDCELCGCDKTEAHHDDYSKPLMVRWLCRRCHGFIHAPKLLPAN
jgi:hypothetical protein